MINVVFSRWFVDNTFFWRVGGGGCPFVSRFDVGVIIAGLLKRAWLLLLLHRSTIILSSKNAATFSWPFSTVLRVLHSTGSVFPGHELSNAVSNFDLSPSIRRMCASYIIRITYEIFYLNLSKRILDKWIIGEKKKIRNFHSIHYKK